MLSSNRLNYDRNIFNDNKGMSTSKKAGLFLGAALILGTGYVAYNGIDKTLSMVSSKNNPVYEFVNNGLKSSNSSTSQQVSELESKSLDQPVLNLDKNLVAKVEPVKVILPEYSICNEGIHTFQDGKLIGPLSDTGLENLINSAFDNSEFGDRTGCTVTNDWNNNLNSLISYSHSLNLIDSAKKEDLLAKNRFANR